MSIFQNINGVDLLLAILALGTIAELLRRVRLLAVDRNFWKRQSLEMSSLLKEEEMRSAKLLIDIENLQKHYRDFLEKLKNV